MCEIKKPNLKVFSTIKGFVADANSGNPILGYHVEPGTLVTVEHDGVEIVVTVTSKTDDNKGYTGKISEIIPNRFSHGDLKIDDKIYLSKENISFIIN